MRYTLEQLKAMDDDMLFDTWFDGHYPFDHAKCGNCLTLHAAGMCVKHVDLVSKHLSSPSEIRKNLEELYAIRIFHDAIYPQPQVEAEDSEQAFARMEENELDSRANTR